MGPTPESSGRGNRGRTQLMHRGFVDEERKELSYGRRRKVVETEESPVGDGGRVYRPFILHLRLRTLRDRPREWPWPTGRFSLD